MYEEAFEKIFIRALFTITKIWKQPKYLSTEEWIMKMWYACVCVYIYIYTHTYIMKYYSARKKE